MPANALIQRLRIFLKMSFPRAIKFRQVYGSSGLLFFKIIHGKFDEVAWPNHPFNLERSQNLRISFGKFQNLSQDNHISHNTITKRKLRYTQQPTSI